MRVRTKELVSISNPFNPLGLKVRHSWPLCLWDELNIEIIHGVLSGIGRLNNGNSGIGVQSITL